MDCILIAFSSVLPDCHLNFEKCFAVYYSESPLVSHFLAEVFQLVLLLLSLQLFNFYYSQPRRIVQGAGEQTFLFAEFFCF